MPKCGTHYELVISTVMFITKQNHVFSILKSWVRIFSLKDNILIKSESTLDDIIKTFGLSFVIASIALTVL